MTTDLVAASVPVCLRYLSRLDALLAAAQAHAKAHGADELTLLQARLASDMLPFSAQVETASYFALRICFPLAGLAVPAFGQFPDGFAGLRQRIAHSAESLRQLHAQAFAGDTSRHIHSQAGKAELVLPAEEFLMQYALPNFFFHLSMAYAILRAQGVALSKEDFDGYHAYRASV
jgi:uncharacterized protein